MSARTIIVIGCLVLLGATAFAEEVSFTPPAVYREHLEKYLTPLEKVREELRHSFPSPFASEYEVLLDERITFVDESGRRTEVEHKIGHILSPDGVGKGSEWQTHFSKNTERYHVALARTICPDGQIAPVETSTILIDSLHGKQAKPSDEDDSETAVTNDDALIVHFPKVAPGCLVEWILVQEDLDFLKSDNITCGFSWGGKNLIRTKRLVLALPNQFQHRLHWKALGVTISEPSQKPGDDGHTLWEWASQDVAPRAFEPEIPRLEEARRQLALSTYSDWTEVGRWLVSTLIQCQEGGDVCHKKAAEWTEGLSEPRAIVSRLYSHVANDLRYGAFSPDQHRLQPRTPDAVLNSGYGDCKDKSNLLRALLKEKGIHSRLALLNALHGRIGDLRFPGLTTINHAILAVDLPGETAPLYCDTAFEHAPLGFVAHGQDYDALLVNEDGACEWRRIPRADMGNFQTAVDLTLEPGGGISGWVTLTMGGAEGAIVHDLIASHDHSWTCGEFSGWQLGGVNTSVIDFSVVEPPAGSPPGTDCYRFYILRSGGAVFSAAAGEKAWFPKANDLLPELSGSRERFASYFVPKMERSITGIIHLPKGWKMTNPPAKFDRSIPGCKVKAEWHQESDWLLVNGSMFSEGSIVEGSKFTQLWDIEQDLDKWVARGATLERGPLKMGREGGKWGKQVWLPAPDSLPKMSSAEAQLKLIDIRFGLDTSTDIPQPILEARRAALASALGMYPEDVTLTFERQFADIVDHIQRQKFQTLRDEMNNLIFQAGNKVDRPRLCLAELRLSILLSLKDHQTEAGEIAELLIGDDAGIPRIRAMAAAIAARALVKSDPQRALQYGRLTLADDGLPDDVFTRVFQMLLCALAKTDGSQPSAIVEEFSASLQRMPNKTQLLRAAITELPGELLRQGKQALADKCWQAAMEAAKGGGFSEKQLSTLTETGEKLKKAGASAHAPKHLQG